MSLMTDFGDDSDIYQHDVQDVWKPMPFTAFDAEGLDNITSGVQLDFSEPKLKGDAKASTDLSKALRLPDLENFTFGEAIDQENPENDSTLSHSEIGLGDSRISQDDDYDMWKNADELGPKRSDIQLLTWEGFYDPELPPVKPAPQYISESGPAVFDAALQEAFGNDPEKQHLASPVVQTDVFLRSMVELGLGRSSIVFPFNQRSGSFSAAIERVRMSGYSGAVAESVIEEHIAMGNSIEQLRSFSYDTLRSSNSSPEHVALASCVSSVLEAIEHFITSNAPYAQTITQIQASFEKPFNLVRILRNLVNGARNGLSSGQLRKMTFGKLVDFEEAQDSLSRILRVIFDRVTCPLLESLAQRVGLEPIHKALSNDNEEEINKHEEEFFDATEEVLVEPDDDPDVIVQFDLISSQDSKLITETTSSLSFLLQAAPEEVISRPYLLVDNRPKLSWAFTLNDVDEIMRKALDYERSIKEVLRRRKLEIENVSLVHTDIELKTSLSSETWDLPDADTVMESIPSLDPFPSYEANIHTDKVTSAALEYLMSSSSQQTGTRVPVEAVISMSLGPLLHVQHNFLSAAALRTLLLPNSLRTHLKVYRKFHLHGSGAFTSRLATVLFSPELVPAERVKGVVRTGQGMGLRLGSGTRRDWPPASSEIRLALMGVLNDSWNDITSSTHRPKSRQRRSTSSTFAITNDSKDLPGGLSFAIRELSEPEIERVLDSDSIYALDFLRLSHTPPPALKILFTPKLLIKYDRVFKLLLRIQRVKYVLDLLFRNTVARTSTFGNQLSDKELSRVHLFISQARHFTLTVSTHFELNGIAGPWRLFESQIDVLEQLVSTESNSTTHAIPSLSSLTSAHASTLSRITSCLFQRKRHAHVAGVLDEILGDVLALARLVRDGSSADTSVKALFIGFRVHVKAFLDACNDLGMKSASKRDREGDEVEDAGPESARMLVELLDWR